MTSYGAFSWPGSMSDSMRLLHALNKYQTWHSQAFLVSKDLVDPDWTREYFDALAEELERDGLVESRLSDTKGVMYCITIQGTLHARRSGDSANKLGQPA
jgi:hypothetical protein